MPSVVSLKRNWTDLAQRDAKGSIKPNLRNARLAISDEIPGFHLDEFSGRVIVSDPLPWNAETGRLWSDIDSINTADLLQSCDLQISVDTVHAAVASVAHARRRHPLREWLSSLVWDGKPRVSRWLSWYLGADSSAYTSAVGQAWLISAVARVFSPGCKADHILVLEGSEGIGKSTAIRCLAGDRYFTDDVAALGTKDAAQQLAGRWLIEMAEMDSIRRPSQFSTVNAFLSRTTDIYRPAYGRHVIEQPRQCIFAGTVNPPFTLPDEDGSRRFWFVPVTSCDTPEIARDRNQLWAEAVTLFHAGEPWWLVEKDAADTARETQAAHKSSDPWEELIADYVIMNTGDVSVKDVLAGCMQMHKEKWTRREEMRVADILKRLGFSKYRKTNGNSWRRE